MTDEIKDFDIDELEDFEAKDATYQIWMLGYDKDENVVDFEVLVNEYKDADRAVEYAKKFVEEKRYETCVVPQEVMYIEVVVETVVQIDDYEENIGNLFTTAIKVK